MPRNIQSARIQTKPVNLNDNPNYKASTMHEGNENYKRERRAVEDSNVNELFKELVNNNLMLQSKISELLRANIELVNAQKISTKILTETSKDIQSMTTLFKEAGEHMIVETEEEKLKPLLGRISELVEQNKTIMRGLILIQKYIRSTTAGEIPQRPIRPEF